jgi:hypothetical protein
LKRHPLQKLIRPQTNVSVNDERDSLIAMDDSNYPLAHIQNVIAALPISNVADWAHGPFRESTLRGGFDIEDANWVQKVMPG